MIQVSRYTSTFNILNRIFVLQAVDNSYTHTRIELFEYQQLPYIFFCFIA